MLIRPTSKILVYYDAEELIRYFVNRLCVSYDELWEWIAMEGEISNGSYGEWDLRSWLEYPEAYPPFAYNMAKILITEFDARDTLAVWYTW